MKIVFLIGGLQKGGAEKVVVNLSNYLSIGHEVTIMTFSSKETVYPLENKVQWIRLEKKQKNKSFLLRNTLRLIRLLKWGRRNKPDIYIAFLPVTSYLILVLKKCLKIPVIVSVRSDPAHLAQRLVHRYSMKFLFPLADGIVVQTEEAKRYFPNSLQKKTFVIPNPVIVKNIKKPDNNNRKKQVVSVGRLEEMKNFRLLIHAMHKLWLEQQCNEYQLVIYGEGKQRKYLEQLIQELNISNKVQLPGICDNIEERIYDASLFVFSSKYEGMPNALLEAMALGLPIISTKFTGGAAEFLIQNGKNGILINDSIDEMAQAIKTVLFDSELAEKLGSQAKKINSELSIESIGKKWEKYVKNISYNQT